MKYIRRISADVTANINSTPTCIQIQLSVPKAAPCIPKAPKVFSRKPLEMRLSVCVCACVRVCVCMCVCVLRVRTVRTGPSEAGPASWYLSHIYIYIYTHRQEERRGGERSGSSIEGISRWWCNPHPLPPPPSGGRPQEQGHTIASIGLLRNYKQVPHPTPGLTPTPPTRRAQSSAYTLPRPARPSVYVCVSVCM